jgi:hypothetical protein
MHHRVGIFNAGAVGAEVVLDHIHHGVVRVAIRPIALPFEERRKAVTGFAPAWTTRRIALS